MFQAVTIFSGPQRTDRYAAVKKMCYLDRGLNSQVVMQKNLANEKKMKTICGTLNYPKNIKSNDIKEGWSEPKIYWYRAEIPELTVVTIY